MCLSKCMPHCTTRTFAACCFPAPSLLSASSPGFCFFLIVALLLLVFHLFCDTVCTYLVEEASLIVRRKNSWLFLMPQKTFINKFYDTVFYYFFCTIAIKYILAPSIWMSHYSVFSDMVSFRGQVFVPKIQWKHCFIILNMWYIHNKLNKTEHFTLTFPIERNNNTLY